MIVIYVIFIWILTDVYSATKDNPPGTITSARNALGIPLLELSFVGAALLSQSSGS